MQHLPMDVMSNSMPNAAIAVLEPTASLRGRLFDLEDSDTLYVAEAESMMDSRGVHGLSITNWHGRSVGLLTRGDVRRHHQYSDERCGACGATTDLVSDPDVDVAFCGPCLDHTRRPEALVDEMYYAIGGEG